MVTKRISRILKILTMLQSGIHRSADEMASVLGTSRRTVFRDLEVLSSVGIPCHYDYKKRAYVVPEDHFLQPTDLTFQEIMGLLLNLRANGDCTCMPLAHEALVAEAKIRSHLSQNTVKHCETLLSQIHFQKQHEDKQAPVNRIWWKLVKAAANRRVVNIRYHYEKKGNLRTDVHPYWLINNNHKWYLLGRCDSDKNTSLFALHRVRDLQVLDKRFIEKKPDLSSCLENAWQIQPEGSLYHIRLRFSEEVVDDVTATRWHRTQTVTYNDDGSAIIEFRVDGLNEITWWILGYGDRVKVLAPLALRQKIARMAQRIVDLNAEQEMEWQEKSIRERHYSL